MFWLKNKSVLLFIVLFIHITFLDLFNGNGYELFVLWEKSIELLTIITHLVIAGLSVLFYLLIGKLRAKSPEG
ncbi:MAG: hypothetical protein HRT37_11480 [Alteromonadaceae bacterium]|nr:hypothetical protein [Alteromonadaceae bacterium]